MFTALLVTTGFIEVVILASLWVVFHQLMQQRGRMLTRMDVLESRFAAVNQLVGQQNQLAARQPAPTGTCGQQAAPMQAGGLGVGAPFSPFILPDLTGNLVGLDDFAGKRLLAVHWNPGCGFCDLIASDLADLQPRLSENNVQLLLLTHGDRDANQKLATEHGLNCPILLLNDANLEAFQNQGTPVAYLLDEQGQIAEPLAVGANMVPALAEKAASAPLLPAADDAPAYKARKPLPGERALSESRLERNGLPVGTPAPLFSLPDLHGDTVSLESYRGRPVLLVFSDPNCGPCNQFSPELVRIHQERSGLSVIYVGRGDAEENRRKAEEHGFEFPAVLQSRWELSKQYGIFATPVAFLIDEQGIIAKNVAQGGMEILALLPPQEASLSLAE